MIFNPLPARFLFYFWALLSICTNIFAKEVSLCERLEQSIQGRKHGFLAGNLAYYVGGFHASWEPIEDETIGLTHPFYHDLRSRGVGILKSQLPGSENTGDGNDYRGWEFYKDTRVLYGSVIIGDKTHKNPTPTRMSWRPDKMICEYEIDGVTIREEKFIGADDAAASIMTASQPVILRFEGHSFYVRHSVSSSASARYDATTNSIMIREGGTVRSLPDPDRPERIGPCVYQGMTTALSSSADFSKSLKLNKDHRGVWEYSFEIPCNIEGVTVSWSMHDDQKKARDKARETILEAPKILSAKTTRMNSILSQQIPQFRCSDPKFEEIYYYLWSLYLMYYIDVQKGWEMENHTQSAVNNFLGIHRYDACFQIKVGAWTRDKDLYAYGNVLTWKHLVENNRFRETPNGLIMLSDNKGIGWHSGAYGGELSEHVLGAWQIYQHTGDLDFLRKCYIGYFKKVFWKKMIGFAMNDFDVIKVLGIMAIRSGYPEDAEHWKKLIKQDAQHIRLMFDQRWQANGHKDYFIGPKNGMLMTNAFWALRTTHFPREYAQNMIHSWALNKEKGFYGKFFPLAMAKQSIKTFSSQDDLAFGYTPDTAYFTLDGIFKQGFPKIASELTLNHLENYNYHKKWGIPVAPEAYRRDLTLFGDQYSNFNAGKILLFLEGLAGLSYSIPENIFHIKDSMPMDWDWMEFDIPIGDQSGWTQVRYERKKSFLGGKQKSITVSNCPLRVKFEPWLDQSEISRNPELDGTNFTEHNATRPDYVSFLADQKSAKSTIKLYFK
ncbi:MAG: hypothetical protein QNL93_06065 [Opitutae bacterium]